MKPDVLDPLPDQRPVPVPIPIKRTLAPPALRMNDPQPERGNEIWLLTLSDLLMLLMIFFVVLFGLAMQKQVQAKHSPSAAANTSATARTVEIAGTRTPAAPPETSGQKDRASALENDLLSALNPGDTPQNFSIRRTADILTLIFPEKIVFDPGQAQLKSSSEDILNKVASFVTTHANLIVEVQGYTDDTPINSTQYPSNWELSVDRATQVARRLIDRGIHPEQISVKGFGEYRPAVPNLSAEDRQSNRRVEIQFSLPPDVPIPSQQKA